MARACVEVGAERHVGRLREHHLPTGFCYLQEGKDLTSVAHVIGTGGIFRMTQQARDILSGARVRYRAPLPVEADTGKIVDRS